MKYFICLFICLLVFFQEKLKAQELDKDVVSLKDACEILIDSPQDKNSLKTLMSYAKNTNGIDRLRSRCMAGVALSALFTGNTNLYVRARNSHASSYPEDTHLLRIDLQSCLVPCKECRGEGFEAVQCPRCQGKGVVPCGVCKGRGTLMKKQALKGSKSVGKFKCETCNGKGKIGCPRCGTKGEVLRKCRACKGKPYTFKASRQVQEDFGLVVRGIVKWINNEDVFNKKYLAAKQIEIPKQRIAAYKQLIKTYSYRDEISELQKQLDEDLKKEREQKKIKNDQQKKEKQEIQTLLRLKDSDIPAAGALTIKEYLRSHPDSQGKLQLQALVNQLEAKAKRKQRNRHLMYVLAGALVLLFGLSCITIKRNKPEMFERHLRFPQDKGD